LAQPYTQVRQWQSALAASKDQPAEVTRGRRIGHLGLQGVFLFFGLCCMLPVGAATLGIEINTLQELGTLNRAIELGKADAYGGVVAALNPQPVVQVVAVHQIGEILDLGQRLNMTLERLQEESDARLEVMSPPGRGIAISQGEARVAMLKLAEDGRGPMAMFSAEHLNPRPMAKAIASRTHRPETANTVLGLAIYLAIWPSIWVVWAFLTLGGLSLRMTGLQLVQSDGRPAAHWRCAARAFLVWSPLFLLLLGSLALEVKYWNDWRTGVPQPWMPWMSWVTWFLVLMLLPAYVALAVLQPTRSLHDRLAGTYLVPR
jgi:hypothetical protein